MIDCSPDQESIAVAIQRLYSKDFQLMLSNVKNPYGEGGASDRVVDTLIKVPLEDILKKRFFDLGNV